MAGPLVEVKLEVLDRQWIRRALEVLRERLVRSQKSEVPGSEIYRLRGLEVESVDKLIARF